MLQSRRRTGNLLLSQARMRESAKVNAKIRQNLKRRAVLDNF